MVRRPIKYGKRSYKDNRDWPDYNEKCVVKGTFFLNLSFVEDWDKELAKMNHGKVGAPYLFPNSFMRWLSVWHQWVDYRGLEGIARSLETLGLIPYFEDYTTAWYRIHKFIPTIQLPSYKDLNIATDGTGCRMTNSGTYKEFKYGGSKRGKYLVVTITVDVKHKKLLDIEAHVEGKGRLNQKLQ